ncbi:unnamed protein product [Closterium sp. Naga37s-1]|nr:unnamed protein product [Closterium sp. Naga37s-1]
MTPGLARLLRSPWGLGVDHPCVSFQPPLTPPPPLPAYSPFLPLPPLPPPPPSPPQITPHACQHRVKAMIGGRQHGSCMAATVHYKVVTEEMPLTLAAYIRDRAGHDRRTSGLTSLTVLEASRCRCRSGSAETRSRGAAIG